MILKKVPASLKGELSRWLIEPETGVFLGDPSARVRDELWNMALKKCREGFVLQIWSRNTPQGYAYRSSGPNDRQMVDFEGIALVRRVERKKRAKQTPGPEAACGNAL